MGYNLTALPQYINQSEYSDSFLVASILGGQTLDFLSDNGAYRGDGVQGATSSIHLMANTLVYQNGKTCGLQELGETVLSEANITVEPIAFNSSYCNQTDLPEKWTVEESKKKKNKLVLDELMFAEAILGELESLNKAEIEKMVWRGNKATGVGNMKMMNGFLTQIESASDTIDLSAITGATTLDKLVAGALAYPVEVSQQEDFRVFLGLDAYNKYINDVTNKNQFHPTAETTLYGSTIKIQVVNGLNGINKAVFGRARNFQTKGDLDNGGSTFNVIVDEINEKLLVRCRFGLGAKLVFSSEVGVLDLA